MSLLSELTKTAARHGVQKKSAGSGILGAAIGMVATRIATRSVPGAILVGGALVGKYLWDKKREKSTAQAEAATIDGGELTPKQAPPAPQRSGE